MHKETVKVAQILRSTSGAGIGDKKCHGTIRTTQLLTSKSTNSEDKMRGKLIAGGLCTGDVNNQCQYPESSDRRTASTY